MNTGCFKELPKRSAFAKDAIKIISDVYDDGEVSPTLAIKEPKKAKGMKLADQDIESRVVMIAAFLLKRY